MKLGRYPSGEGKNSIYFHDFASTNRPIDLHKVCERRVAFGRLFGPNQAFFP